MARILFAAVLAVCSCLCVVGASLPGGSLSVPVVRNPNYVPNGPLEYAKALSKWGVKLPKGLARHVFTKGETGVVSAISQSDDREYLTPIGIGTPPQTLLLDLDTGSSDFWVYSSETKAADLKNRTGWVPGSSSTAHIIPNATWSIQYGDGSFAYGHAWKDTISFGGVTIPDAVVESAVDVSSEMAQDLAMCGIFGLAFGLESQVEPKQKTVLRQMSSILKRNLFTTDLKYHAEGTYTFGTIDKTKYNGDIHWSPLSRRAEYWQFNFTGFNVDSSDWWYFSQWSAIADTGTTLLMLDDDIVRFYYDEVQNATFNSTLGLWTYPCGTILPDFNMKLGNWTATVPGRYINYTDLDGSRCMGGLQGNFGTPFGILGDVFLKAFFAVFDVAGRRVGFANKDLN